ncbi:response regulator [Streptomyces dysideae]|uniref:response regulator n=1 Tax=Streptomyces dysideae TaxID=909626 RepID=UPI00099E833F|nr:response regulator transcription factor [Streptomyces dysideae]
MTGPPDLITVLLVEDHRAVAEGLWALLDDYDDLTVVGWADSVAEAVPMTEQLSPQLALIDYRLPDGTGADAAARIRAHNPGPTSPGGGAARRLPHVGRQEVWTARRGKTGQKMVHRAAVGLLGRPRRHSPRLPLREGREHGCAVRPTSLRRRAPPASPTPSRSRVVAGRRVFHPGRRRRRWHS